MAHASCEKGPFAWAPWRALPGEEHRCQTPHAAALQPAASEEGMQTLRSPSWTRLNRKGELCCLRHREELREGSEVQAMPCKHAFHPNCLKPWLLEHRNTCPTCRYGSCCSPSPLNAKDVHVMCCSRQLWRCGAPLWSASCLGTCTVQHAPAPLPQGYGPGTHTHTHTPPTPRHELPTDNPQYERRKERERVEAEERRGVENAVSHNEFLYI